MSKIISRKLDPAALPPLTAVQKKRLAKLAAEPDATIDYSDSAPLGASAWKRAVSNPFYKPTKQSTTVRVDSDVLHWLKSKGDGYQTRLNGILRDAMKKEFKV